MGLGAGVYLWNASNGNIQELVQLKGVDNAGVANCVTSLSWSRNGETLAVGTSTAEIQLWDTKNLVMTRSIKVSHRPSQPCPGFWFEFVPGSPH